MNPGNYQMLVGKRWDTGKKWNGEVIYAKIIDVGALPNNTTKDVAHSENVDVNKWCKAHVFATDGTNNLAVHRDLTIQLTATNVSLVTGTNLSSYTQGYAYIEFVDTTDEGS